MREYRVEEFNNKFTIQILTKTIKFRLFRKNKVIKEWKDVGSDGKVAYHFRKLGGNELGSFNNLGEALSKINVFKKGIKYHYPDVKKERND